MEDTIMPLVDEDVGKDLRTVDSRVPVNPPITGILLSAFDSDDECDNFELYASDVEPEPAPPSTNIKTNFDVALREVLDFKGELAVATSYTINLAPNPCLELEGVGTVGLPLSERDARAIISVCETLYTPETDSEPGIWEMAADKIVIGNPNWDTWIQQGAGVLALHSLTKSASAASMFALQKLVIHTTDFKGTSQTGFIDTDSDVSGHTFSHLIAVLPGRHEGGQLHFRHGGATKSLDTAHESGRLTSLVAAYSNLEHTMSAVTSGYRLSLVYDILQPTLDGGSCPSLPDMQTVERKLRNVLLSWRKDRSENAAASLASLLQHKYDNISNFCAESLTGRDALLVSHLRPLARDLGFRVLFAHIRFTVLSTALASEDGDSDGYYDYDWERSVLDEMDFTDVDQQEDVTIDQVMDLSGMPVVVQLHLDPEDLLSGSATDTLPDEHSFDRESRTEATRTQVYIRTVLLIWPKNGTLDLTVTVDEAHDYACSTLQNSTTASPTRKEKLLVDNLLQWCESHLRHDKLAAVQALTQSACRWQDVQMLLRVLKAYKVDENTSLLGVESFVSCCKVFGWGALKGFFNDAMQNEGSNTSRDALLAGLKQMAAEGNDADLSTWCKNQDETSLLTLRKIDPTEIPSLIDRSLSHGGEFLRDIIFPQLRTQELSRIVWIAFLEHLHQSLTTISPPSAEIVRALITYGVSEIVRDLPPFPLQAIEGIYTTIQTPDPDAILIVIKLCVETGNASCCLEIFAKMRDAVRRGTFDLIYPWHYYTDLFRSLSEYLRSTPGFDDIFRPFFADVVVSIVSFTCTTSEGKAVPPCTLSAHLPMVIAATRNAGGIDILNERLNPDVLKGRDSGTLQELARAVANEFPRDEIQDAMSMQARDEVLITLVRAAIDAFQTLSLVEAPWPAWHSTSPEERMIALVMLCFETGAQSQCEYLLPRFFPPPAGTLKEYVADALAPFFHVLRNYLLMQGLDFTAEPYRTLAIDVTTAFAEEVMTAKPDEVVPLSEIQTIGCNSCLRCGTLRNFLLGEEPTISLRCQKSIQTHLQHKLARTSAWGVVWESTKDGIYPVLKITKPDSITALAVWSVNSQIGKTLLDGLGDASTQARVLGDEYHRVHTRIWGTDDMPGPLATADYR
ncbi:hypothetical protein C8R44DRAFT_794600 [Mycena epipterygia]|nr:hypothetical protein C8R44DRAFT_794600 [Mycena epipterygia]